MTETYRKHLDKPIFEIYIKFIEKWRRPKTSLHSSKNLDLWKTGNTWVSTGKEN